MHIPDGFCSLPVCAGAAVLAAGAVGWSVRHTLREKVTSAAVPATATGVVFAAQMANFPVGAGTSGHFLGAAAAAILLGPYRACLLLLTVLTVQAVAFADGGISALGANLLNMGVIAGFGGYAMIRGLTAFAGRGRKGLLTAVAVGSWCSVMLAAVACCVELALSGTLPLGISLPAMLGTHALIGAGEALIAVALIGVVSAARPDLLPDWCGINAGKAGTAEGATAAALPVVLGGAGLALLLAAAVSPFASTLPDGLERMAQDTGLAGHAQAFWTLAPFSDYLMAGVAAAGLSTALAGMAGVVLVLAGGTLVQRAVSRVRVK